MKTNMHDAGYVSRAKDTFVAFIGGGIAGLMMSLLLESVRIHN